jgi:Predicted ester cyclase
VNEKAVPVYRTHQEIMVEGKESLIDEIYGEDFVDHSPGIPEGMRNGPESMRQHYRFLWSAFSDMAIEHHDLIVDGDMVGVRWTWHATHSGPFLGIPPTGARVTLEGYDLILVRDGKIRGAWVYQDNLALMAQLGAATARGAPG